MYIVYKIHEDRKTSNNQIAVIWLLEVAVTIPEEPGIPTLILGDVDHQAEPIKAYSKLSESNQGTNAKEKIIWHTAWLNNWKWNEKNN